MKIYVANDSKPQQGGGFSWISYFKRGVGESITENYDEATHFLIAGASMIKPERAEQAKADGKKVVLRVDNILRHSRNQGKGMSRMQRMAQVADVVIYQCEWAKTLLDPFLGYPNNYIVYNGVDLNIFKPEGQKIDFASNSVYLYAAASKGENKRWDAAYYDYIRVQQSDPNAILLIAGKVSTPVMQNNFDFFNQERYHFLGMKTSPEDMAVVYRSADFFYAVAENDCYSNALLEAAMCGVEFRRVSMSGGTPELLKNLGRGREYNGLDRMVQEYKQAIE